MPSPTRRRGRKPTIAPDLGGVTPPEINPFLIHLATERGLAHNSLEAYRRDLTDLLVFLQRRGLTIRSASAIDYREYLQDQTRGGQSTSTVSRRLAAIRAYCKYLAVEGIDKTNDLQQLDRPKLERRIPRVLSRTHLDRLLAAPDPNDLFYFRDVALLEFLYASGLRATEICELDVQDVNLLAGAVRVLGKGSKERVVPVGQAARQAIEAYLTRTRPSLLKNVHVQRLFLSRSGRPLERVALWKIVKRAALRCGVYNEVHPHVLRHCFASHLVEGGADLRIVQELLGHADVSTTQIYTHVDARRLKRVHEAYHPRR